MIIDYLLQMALFFLALAALFALGLLSSPVGGLDKKEFNEKKLFLDRNLSDALLQPRERIFIFLHRYVFLYFLYRWDLLIYWSLGLSAFFYTINWIIRGARWVIN